MSTSRPVLFRRTECVRVSPVPSSARNPLSLHLRAHRFAPRSSRRAGSWPCCVGTSRRRSRARGVAAIRRTAVEREGLTLEACAARARRLPANGLTAAALFSATEESAAGVVRVEAIVRGSVALSEVARAIGAQTQATEDSRGRFGGIPSAFRGAGVGLQTSLTGLAAGLSIAGLEATPTDPIDTDLGVEQIRIVQREAVQVVGAGGRALGLGLSVFRAAKECDAHEADESTPVHPIRVARKSAFEAEWLLRRVGNPARSFKTPRSRVYLESQRVLRRAELLLGLVSCLVRWPSFFGRPATQAAIATRPSNCAATSCPEARACSCRKGSRR